MAPRIHVVGAGLAGLAAAVKLADLGYPVTLYEQAGHAGGRCRSFFDEGLGRSIDNGNHLVLSGNRSLFAFLSLVGATDRLTGPTRAAFPFADLQTGERWTLRPGSLPWWIFVPKRRVPGTRPLDYLACLRIVRPRSEKTVAECIGSQSALYRRFWDPLTVAVLNTRTHEAAARLLWPVLRETFGRGEAACRPRIAIRGLGDGFVDPAIAFLRQRGVELRFRARLRHFAIDGGRIRELAFANGSAASVADGEWVVLAVPPTAAGALVPGLVTPQESRAIVNAHFRVSRRYPAPDFLGLVGGLSQWIFVRDDVVSVTVSAADGLAEEPNDEIAPKLWSEVCSALQFADPRLPAWRIVKEKRATFAQTPAELARRPSARTRIGNLVLAGDWTDTGLPATLEGSVRSGHTAGAAISEAAASA